MADILTCNMLFHFKLSSLITNHSRHTQTILIVLFYIKKNTVLNAFLILYVNKINYPIIITTLIYNKYEQARNSPNPPTICQPLWFETGFHNKILCYAWQPITINNAIKACFSDNKYSIYIQI